MYDYLIVGAGIFGAVFAREARRRGRTCLVIDRRAHIAGNTYTENVEGIQVHRYGAHIFHTSNDRVWNYVREFADFNHFINAPIAIYDGKVFNLPFNMNTFYAMWGTRTPAEAMAKIEEQIQEASIEEPRNLEEQAIHLVGTDIYHKLIEGYTQKQWGRPCRELPASIIRRLPVRFTYDNNYFTDPYQGIPKDGYTALVARMLEGIEVRLETDFLQDRAALYALARKVVFTGPIDAYFDYAEGTLAYRSLRFETDVLPMANYQGCAVVNYTQSSVPYTRIIEHKHFAFGTQDNTVVTREYPQNWEKGLEPYYPIPDAENQRIYARYAERARTIPNVIFGGRLGEYRYYDMDKVVARALEVTAKELAT